MIYIDPPYGVKFGSNFQPFVRKPRVLNGVDGEFTREPEMVRAYRDTWELGSHSYLTYLRDRLFISRELLCPSGSIFIQISEENVHWVRQVLDEVFGAENSVTSIVFAKTTSSTSNLLSSVFDTLLWYAKDKKEVKYNQLYSFKIRGRQGATGYTRVRLEDGDIRPASELKMRPENWCCPSALNSLRLVILLRKAQGHAMTSSSLGRFFDQSLDIGKQTSLEWRCY
jgi:adenine-specific DNA-methyltransferase